MKKSISVILSIAVVFGSLALLSVLAGAAQGRSYYIDSALGNDLNSGTSPESAWKSIENLKSLSLGAGDKVLFKRGGTYNCELTLTCSGTKENPIIISAYGEGNKPVLTTDSKTEVLRLFDCSYITVEDIELTAHNGGGIWIDTLEKTSYGISICNVAMHDIQNYKVNSRDNLGAGAAAARACVMVKGLPSRSRYAVNDLTISNCEMYDCGNGISIWGSWNDEQTPWCENESDIDPVFNEGVLVEYCDFHDMDAEAIIVGMCNGALVTHCRSINCCQGEGTDENGKVLYYTAAMWFWGSVNSTIEYCEIAGQKNVGDGMAVDFDSYTHNCTYQYIYSHDNTRFMCNCPNYSGHHNNTVRYCLSVNDNRGRSSMAGSAGEHGFRFYNNTLVNCGELQMNNVHDALIANNIFVLAEGATIAYDVDAPFKNVTFTNNCYYNYLNPAFDLNSVNCLPGFVSENTGDKNSFILSADSPLIGAGIKINDGLTEDFFGNELDSCNIGCYSGTGAEAEEYQPESGFGMIVRYIVNIFKFLYHEISVIID